MATTETEALLKRIESACETIATQTAAQIDSEALLAVVGEFLRIPGSDFEADEIARASASCLEILRHIAQSTWYRCSCGPISPLSGSIDAICDKCGELRRLPPRLSRAPWPMAIACYQRRNPNGWFEELACRMTADNTGEVENGAYPQDSAAGGGAYPAQPDSDAGDASPAPRIIRCIDGMIITETAEIKGLSWIALPIPT